MIYYAITAAGIDKIESPSEYTLHDRFAGIVNVNASGQSTVTVGDGNAGLSAGEIGNCRCGMVSVAILPSLEK